MASQHKDKYTLEEFSITLTDSIKRNIETAYAADVAVFVEFDYTPENESDAAQVYVNAVRAAAPVSLDAGEMALNINAGTDIIEYLTHTQIDQIEEEMHRRMIVSEVFDTNERRIDAAIDARSH